MMGGGGAIGSFLNAGQIDDFIIPVNPTFIGEGIRLILPHHREVKLNLASSRRFSGVVARLHFRVLPGESEPPDTRYS